MTAYAHHDFDECVLAEVQVYDLQTGSNWIAEIRDTEDEIYRRWLKAEALLEKAGLILGWHPDGIDRGTVDHLVLVREAVDRCWLQHAADLVP